MSMANGLRVDSDPKMKIIRVRLRMGCDMVFEIVELRSCPKRK